MYGILQVGVLLCRVQTLLQNAFTTELPLVLLICYTRCSCTNKVMIAVWLAAIEQSFSCSDINCGLSFHNM
jgi:hypothetical protein